MICLIVSLNHMVLIARWAFFLCLICELLDHMLCLNFGSCVFLLIHKCSLHIKDNKSLWNFYHYFLNSEIFVNVFMMFFTIWKFKGFGFLLSERPPSENYKNILLDFLLILILKKNLAHLEFIWVQSITRRFNFVFLSE